MLVRGKESVIHISILRYAHIPILLNVSFWVLRKASKQITNAKIGHGDERVLGNTTVQAQN